MAGLVPSVYFVIFDVKQLIFKIKNIFLLVAVVAVFDCVGRVVIDRSLGGGGGKNNVKNAIGHA